MVRVRVLPGHLHHYPTKPSYNCDNDEYKNVLHNNCSEHNRPRCTYGVGPLPLSDTAASTTVHVTRYGIDADNGLSS